MLDMVKRGALYGGLLLLGLLAGGCLYYGPQAASVKDTTQDHPVELAYFSYTRDEAWPAAEELRDWGLYRVQKFKMPTSLQTEIKQNGYHIFYYRPKGPGPFPGVVILPITRGDYYTQNFAIYLAEHGYACLRFESTRNFTDDSQKTLEGAERLLKHYVMDVRRGMDWLAARQEVDPRRLGIMGISLGALVAGVVMEADPRIQAGVFLLGGGDLAAIIDTTGERSVVRFRQRVLEEAAMNPSDFRRAATQALKPVDPLTYAYRLDPTRVLMINGYFDRVIRREYVRAFWEASGRPELVFIPTGHYSAGFFIAYARAKALAHFEKILR